MSKKITWKKRSVFQWFCWYLLILSIVNVLVITILIWYYPGFKIPEDFNQTIIVILSILGVFIAFTAINIYSVFNSRVEEEKQKLEKMIQKCNTDIQNFDKRNEILRKEFDNLEKKINQNLQGIDNYNLQDDIFDIKHSDVLLEKVRAIFALTERIEIIKKTIDETDSIKEKERLDENLLSLKITIKQNLEPYYKKIDKINNKTFKDIFNDFKALLDEETVV